MECHARRVNLSVRGGALNIQIVVIVVVRMQEITRRADDSLLVQLNN